MCSDLPFKGHCWSVGNLPLGACRSQVLMAMVQITELCYWPGIDLLQALCALRGIQTQYVASSLWSAIMFIKKFFIFMLLHLKNVKILIPLIYRLVSSWFRVDSC